MAIQSSKVKEAREAYKAKALQILELYHQNIKKLYQKGEHQAAAEAMQWFLEHAPKDEGITILDPSVDKTKGSDDSVNRGPTIQIGFALGGLFPAPAKTVELPPAEVTDAEVKED